MLVLGSVALGIPPKLRGNQPGLLEQTWHGLWSNFRFCEVASWTILVKPLEGGTGRYIPGVLLSGCQNGWELGCNPKQSLRVQTPPLGGCWYIHMHIYMYIIYIEYIYIYVYIYTHTHT